MALRLREPSGHGLGPMALFSYLSDDSKVAFGRKKFFCVPDARVQECPERAAFASDSISS